MFDIVCMFACLYPDPMREKLSGKASKKGRGEGGEDEGNDSEELKLSPKEIRRPQVGSTDWTKQVQCHLCSLLI